LTTTRIHKIVLWTRQLLSCLSTRARALNLYDCFYS